MYVYEIHVHSYIKIEVQWNFFNNLYHVLLDLRIYFFQHDKTLAHFQMGLAALWDAWHSSQLGQRKMFQSILFLYPNQSVTQSIKFTNLKQYKEMMKREKNPSVTQFPKLSRNLGRRSMSGVYWSRIIGIVHTFPSTSMSKEKYSLSISAFASNILVFNCNMFIYSVYLTAKLPSLKNNMNHMTQLSNFNAIAMIR